MIALYRDGTSVVHRLPAWVKLVVTAVVVFTVSLVPHTPVSLSIVAAMTVGCYLIAGLGILEVWRQLVAFRWLIVFALASQLVFLDTGVALVNTGRITVIIVFATLLTLTTTTADLLATTERALTPLSRIGVNPQKLSLVLAMTITTIPVIASFAATIREAQLARGVRVSPHNAVVPLMVMSLKHADDMAEAMIARGLD